MRISDWRSDVCSSDLEGRHERHGKAAPKLAGAAEGPVPQPAHAGAEILPRRGEGAGEAHLPQGQRIFSRAGPDPAGQGEGRHPWAGPLSRRSEEHTSELQSLMRSSYAVFCLIKKHYHYNGL